MNYNIKELEEKLKNSEELSEKEYEVIIRYHKNKTIMRSLSLFNESYFDNFLQLSLLKERAELYGEDAHYLPFTCDFMIGTYFLNELNFANLYEDCINCGNTFKRFNTLTLVRESDEVFKYDSAIGELYDGIMQYSALGFDFFRENVLEDEMNKLKDHRAKIKTYRKKFLK